MQPGITNNLAAIRKQRGVAASELAKTVGVTRQTIYAIESGNYVPNTALGLHLARALKVGFEELFSLAQAHASGNLDAILPGQPVQLCRIDGNLFAVPAATVGDYLPVSDATVSARSRAKHRAKVRLHDTGERFENRLMIAGCDPAMSVLARHLQPFGVEVLLLHRNSSESLALLKHGYAHIAGTHLRDEASGQSNLGTVNKLFRNSEVSVISFAVWEEGLVTAASNPKNIKGLQDLARKDVNFINREEGSGSRRHLDSLLGRLKIDSKLVRGYSRSVHGHLAAASQVNRGAADCCIATQSAARLFGLHFIPLESVRFDFVIQRRHLDMPQARMLFETLNGAPFRRKLESIGGYQTRVTGERLL